MRHLSPLLLLLSRGPSENNAGWRGYIPHRELQFPAMMKRYEATPKSYDTMHSMKIMCGRMTYCIQVSITVLAVLTYMQCIALLPEDDKFSFVHPTFKMQLPLLRPSSSQENFSTVMIIFIRWVRVKDSFRRVTHDEGPEIFENIIVFLCLADPLAVHTLTNLNSCLNTLVVL